MGTEIVIEGMEDVVVATDTEVVVIEAVVLEEAVVVAAVVVVALIAASPVILLETAGKIISENREAFYNIVLI